MIRRSLMIAMVALVALGCDSSEPRSATTPEPHSAFTSSVLATDVTKPMVGRWGLDGEETLIISLEGDRVVISGPANYTWRMEIHDAEILDDSIHFVLKHYLQSGEPHPFSGVACNSTAKIIDGDKLELETTTVNFPESQPDILTRLE